jgi:hypothetical protein
MTFSSRNLGREVDLVMAGHPADLAPGSTARAYDRSALWDPTAVGGTFLNPVGLAVTVALAQARMF